MAKKNHTLTYIGGALIIGTVWYIVSKRNSNALKVAEINKILDGSKQDPSAQQGGGQVVIEKALYDKLPTGNFPLKAGQKNKKIYDLQKYLNQNYGSNVDLDGVFGQGTADALNSKFWSWHVPGYIRDVSQADFDEIKAHKK